MKRSITAGIDFGNQACVLSIPSRYGIDIVLNQSSNRKTPTIIGYDNDRRYSGEFALQQQMMNISNTITNIKRLICLEYSSIERKEISNTVSYTIINSENDKFSSIQLQNEQILRPEQVIAYLLKSLLEIIQMKNPDMHQIVLTVPPWWNDNQRRSILHSASIANIKIASLLNSTTAAAVAYVKIHSDRFPVESGSIMNVIFIDIGDTSMNVAVASLTAKSVDMRSFVANKEISGHFFTEKLNDYLIEKVQEKYNIDPKSNKRAIARFQQATEKVKKALSANPVMMFEVPSLMNDIDVSITVKRDDFNKLFENTIEKIESIIGQSLKDANLSKEEVSAVEFLGGASRMPAIKAVIKNFFGFEPMMSLDLDECFAIGAGYIAAKEDGYNIGIDTINSILPFEICVEYEEDGQKCSQKVFMKNSRIPSRKTFSIPVENRSSFVLLSDGVVIGSGTIATDRKEKVLVDVSVLLDSFGLINVCSASYSVEHNADNRVEEEKVMNESKTAINNETQNNEQNQDKTNQTDKVTQNENKPSEKVNDANEADSILIQEETDDNADDIKNDGGQSSQKGGEKSEEVEKDERASTNASTAKSADSSTALLEGQKKPEANEDGQAGKEGSKKTVFKATFSYTPLNSFSPEVISEFAKLEEEMTAKDKNEMEIDNTKNKLESLIFTIENELNSLVSTTDAERADISKIKEKVTTVHNWFEENEFERLALSDYKEKVSELNEQINKLYEYKKYQTNLSILDELKQQLMTDFQLLKCDTERSNTKESILLQNEISGHMSHIDEMMMLPKPDVCKFDIDSLDKRVTEMNCKTETFQNTPFEKVPSQKVENSKVGKSKVNVVNLTNDDLSKPSKPHKSAVNPQKSRIKLPPLSPKAKEKDTNFQSKKPASKPKVAPPIVHPQSKVSPRQRTSANPPSFQPKKRNVTTAPRK
ncbi:hypothetical protein M9Y10_031118 [Tritrichomonas musculus]|uniref:DnaK protein n=1 Tax=Tritrichomonas musculus TaxID=1915356 RepID=A0ABR2H1U6_9EUKA